MKIIRWTLLPLLFFLAGCVTIISTNGQLKIGANEKWDIKLEVEVPAYEVQAYGAYLTQSLNEFVQEAKAKGAQANWSQKGPSNDGNITYTVSFNGTGFDKFNSIITSAQLATIEQNGKPVITFHMAPLDIGLSRSTNFELIGGNILQTNGTKVNSTTVRWNQAMAMEAVMEPPGNSGTAAFWAFVVIIGVFIILGYKVGWFRKRPAPELRTFSQPGYQTYSTLQDTAPPPIVTSAPSPEQVLSQEINSSYPPQPSQSPVEHNFCPNCGAAWIIGARFCNRCGFRG